MRPVQRLAADVYWSVTAHQSHHVHRGYVDQKAEKMYSRQDIVKVAPNPTVESSKLVVVQSGRDAIHHLSAQ